MFHKIEWWLWLLETNGTIFKWIISSILIFANILSMSIFQMSGSGWSSDIDANRFQESSRFHTSPGSVSDSASSTELSGHHSKSIWYAIAQDRDGKSKSTWWRQPVTAPTHPSSERQRSPILTTSITTSTVSTAMPRNLTPKKGRITRSAVHEEFNEVQVFHRKLRKKLKVSVECRVEAVTYYRYLSRLETIQRRPWCQSSQN